jgi:hypothetical protein
MNILQRYDYAADHVARSAGCVPVDAESLAAWRKAAPATSHLQRHAGLAVRRVWLPLGMPRENR